jgi:hypothetical protein
MKRCLTARFTRTQTRKVGRASKVLLPLVALCNHGLGPVNGGVRLLKVSCVCAASIAVDLST